MKKNTKETDRLRHCEEMAEMWQFRGNQARDRGNIELAERHYARSQKWRDEMNELLGNGDG